ncbi:MAG: MFS transporter [Jatrophihabitans sp.]
MTPAASGSRTPLLALATAKAITMTGSRMSALALPWLVLVTSGSPTRTGLVGFAEITPLVLVQGLSGPVVDRLGARRMSVLGSGFAAVSVGLVPVLVRSVGLPFVALLLLVAASGATQGLASNADNAMTPAAIEHADASMDRSLAMVDGAYRLAGLLGAALGGLLIGLMGASNVLYVDAVTFLIAAVLVRGWVRLPSLDRVSATEHDPDGKGYLGLIAEGVRWIAAHRLLRAIAAMVLVTNLLDQAMSAVLAPVWAHDVQGSAVALGVVGGTFGAGALIGNGLWALWGSRLPRYQTYLLAFLVVGAPRFAVIAFAGHQLAVIAVVVFLGGVGAGAINPILGATMYEQIPVELRTRVLGGFDALCWAGMPLGSLLGGWLISRSGLTTALSVAGGLYLLATLLPAVRPVWRQLGTRPKAADPAGQRADQPVGLDA